MIIINKCLQFQWRIRFSAKEKVSTPTSGIGAPSLRKILDPPLNSYDGICFYDRTSAKVVVVSNCSSNVEVCSSILPLLMSVCEKLIIFPDL